MRYLNIVLFISNVDNQATHVGTNERVGQRRLRYKILVKDSTGGFLACLFVFIISTQIFITKINKNKTKTQYTYKLIQNNSRGK